MEKNIGLVAANPYAAKPGLVEIIIINNNNKRGAEYHKVKTRHFRVHDENMECI